MQRKKYRFIPCFIALLEIAISIKIPSKNFVRSEDVKIYPIPSPNFEMKQPEFVHDRQLQLKFVFHNEIIELLLVPDKDESSNVLVYSMNASEIYRIDAPNSKRVVPQRYKGENSSFSMVCEWNPHYWCQISGVFFYRGILLGVVPLEINKRSRKENSRVFLEKIVGSWHRIFKPPSNDNWIWPRISFWEDMHSFQNHFSRQKRLVTERYIIELALILHRDVFSEFMKVLPRTFNYEQIVYFIKEYYYAMSRGMDFMFKTMSSQQFSIGIKLTSLIYAYDKNSSALFRDKNLNWIKFNRWFHQPSNTVSQMCDHAMLLTMEKIFEVPEYSMCTKNSTSIIQELFGFRTAMRAVYILAVSFGIKEDGPKNTCSELDQNIMASHHFVARDKMNSLNRFRFSKCSQNYLETFLKSNEKSFCLVTESNFTISYEEYSLMPSGQRFTASQQCQLKFGQESDIYKCEYENFQNQDMFCAEMACFLDGLCTEMIPLEGTSCGPHQWCELGYCTANHQAPDIPMACWLGDKIENSILSNKNFTCKDIAYGYTFMCYDKEISSICCWTCFFLRSTQENCPYGDRSNDCWENECMFYSPQKINYDCCSTCQLVSGSYRENRWHIGLFILAAMPLKINLL